LIDEYRRGSGWKIHLIDLKDLTGEMDADLTTITSFNLEFKALTEPHNKAISLSSASPPIANSKSPPKFKPSLPPATNTSSGKPKTPSCYKKFNNRLTLRL
jgi:hypothetical protein